MISAAAPPRPPAAIEVLAIRPFEGKGAVRAFCDVKIGAVTIKGCKIVQQDGQRAWVAMPASKGSHGWTNVVEIDKPLRDRITAAVLEAWQQSGGEP